MTPLLVGLLAITVVGWVVHAIAMRRITSGIRRRFGRLERILGENQVAVHALRKEMDRIADAEPESEPDAMSDTVRAELDGVLRLAESLESSLVEVRALASMRPGGSPHESEEEGLSARVVRHLADEGYERVSLLDGEIDEGSDPARVSVRAHRNGAEYRGHVTVSSETGVSSELRPSYGMFP